METQKTLSSQSNLGKEQWNWWNQSPRLQTILQSHSHQESMVLAQKNRHLDQRNKIESLEINHAPMGTLSLTKEAKLYNGEKTACLISGAGKTGRLLLKGASMVAQMVKDPPAMWETWVQFLGWENPL